MKIIQIILTLLGVILFSPLEKTHGGEKPPPFSAKDFVLQLGDESFDVREAAYQKLREMGEKVKGALLNGTKSQRPEIRLRCQELLSLLTEKDLEARIQAFLKSPDDPTFELLPGWGGYQKATGAKLEERKKFTEIYRVSSEIFEEYERDPQNTVAVLKNWADFLKKQFWRAPDELVLENYLALVVVWADAQLEKDRQTYQQLQYLLDVVSLWPEIQKKIKNDTESQLILAYFLKNSPHPSLWEKNLQVLTRLELKNQIPFVLGILKNKSLSPQVRAQAILTVGKWEAKEASPQLEVLLKDTIEVSRKPFRGKVIYTQVRDVALASLIHLRKEKLADYGFPYHKAIPGQSFQVGPACYGFTTAAGRENAFAQWAKTR